MPHTQSYLDSERVSIRNSIIEKYEHTRSSRPVPSEYWATALRLLTFDKDKHVSKNIRDNRWSCVEEIAANVDLYVQKYNIVLDKDVTLEEAISKI